MCRNSLSLIGSGDVDGAETILRIAQRGQYFADPVEAELGGFDFVAQRVKEAHGVGIREDMVTIIGCYIPSTLRSGLGCEPGMSDIYCFS